MKTDDEEESASEDQHHRARPYPRTLTMSRVKGRRRIRPRTALTASLTSTSGISSTGSLETDTSETSSRTPDIFFIYNDGKQKGQTGKQLTGQFTRRRGKSAALFASTKGACRLTLSEHGSKKAGKLSHTTSVTSQSSDYLKHSNLDVRDLSFQERLRLARIHYFTFSNACRLLLIAVCLGWFIYNATTILRGYSDYETQVYMEYRPPERTLPPAISICSYGSNLLQNLSVLEAVSVPMDTEGLPGDSLSLFASLNSSLSMADMKIRCRYHTTTVSNVNGSILDCADLVPVVVSIQEGKRCYTFMSDIYGQMSRINQSNEGQFRLQFELFPLLRIELNGSLLSESSGNDELPGEAASTDSNSALGKQGSGKVFLTLHDPKLLPDMQDIPLHQIISEENTRMVDIRFEKTVEVLLKPPYNTRCHQYDALREWTPFIDSKDKSPLQYYDLYQYRSTGECILYCLWRLLKTDSCLNSNTIFTFELANASETRRKRRLRPTDADVSLQFCADESKKSTSRYLEAKQTCLQECNKDCTVETFNMDANIIEYDGVPEPHTAIIDITWSPESFTYIEHKEKMESTEMMGELGGHIHIWLGISVITVIRYLIHLVKTGDILPSTSCCCMLLWWKAILPGRKVDT